MSSPNFAAACALKNVETARKWQSCHPHFSGRNFKHKAPPWHRLSPLNLQAYSVLPMQSPTFFLHIIIWVKEEEKADVEEGKKESNMNPESRPCH